MQSTHSTHLEQTSPLTGPGRPIPGLPGARLLTMAESIAAVEARAQAPALLARYAPLDGGVDAAAWAAWEDDGTVPVVPAGTTSAPVGAGITSTLSTAPADLTTDQAAALDAWAAGA